MRIFPEGYEQTFEPFGRAFSILGKLMLAVGIVAALFSRLVGAVLSILGVSFWLGGKACVSLGQWMKRRGLQLP